MQAGIILDRKFIKKQNELFPISFLEWLRVRKALTYAINRDEILKQFLE